MMAEPKKTYLLHKRGSGSFSNLNVSGKWMVDRGGGVGRVGANFVLLKGSKQLCMQNNGVSRERE